MSADPSTAKQWWLIEIELKRIQTYLFEVPRLRAMIGANALVGETLRGVWDGSGFCKQPESLPGLAQACGSAWPQALGVPAPDAFNFPRNGDPLESPHGWQDDVATVASETGVLTRDGGHFEALFPSGEQAHQFFQRAHESIARQLPGARLEGRLFRLNVSDDGFRKAQDPEPLELVATQSVFDLPQAEICQLSGNEPACPSDVSAGKERYHAGPSSKARWTKGEKFDQGDTHDVLGILRDELLRRVGADPELECRAFPGKRSLAAEFGELSVQGYLAVVRVDGNSVGKRFKTHALAVEEKDFFSQWASKEAFFHTLRCGMRRAVLAAIEAVFRGKLNRQGKVPLRVLMLGGDDLVVVCGAPYALPFVRHLASSVREHTAGLPGEAGARASLDIGAGVAIVQDSFPFHRAHQLAEQLASSAKRIKHLGSAVDWIVTSESWYGDIADTRRRTALIDQKLILSRKPYPILDSDGRPGLQKLLSDAENLGRNESLARGQLQRLTDSLAQGRHTAHFVAQTLPQSTRLPLQELGYIEADDDPWRPVDKCFATQLLDLFELYELERLARIEEGNLPADADKHQAKEAAHA